MPSGDLNTIPCFQFVHQNHIRNGIAQAQPYEWDGLPPLGEMAKPKEKAGKRKKQANQKMIPRRCFKM
jgi:hypothetical protein